MFFFATALNMIWIKPCTKVAVTIGIMHRNKLSNKLAWEKAGNQINK